MKPTDYRSIIEKPTVPTVPKEEDTYCADEIEIEEPKTNKGINWVD